MGNSNEPQVKANIFAAGALLWRRTPGSGSQFEVAVVHRPRYDDWSFPKGKNEPGETNVLAAVREVREETGMDCRLGRHIDRVTYPVPGHRKLKRVDYWAAEATGGRFVASREVDEMLWLPASAAHEYVSYPMDRRVLRNMLRYPVETNTTIVVRHARAGRRDRYKGDDALRPLDKLGRAQAEALAPHLLAFGATNIHAADNVRCIQTVEPLARRLGADIRREPLLTENAYQRDRDATHDRVAKIADKSGVRVICSQGKVIPDLLAWWASRDGIGLPPARNRKGSVWVLSHVGGTLISAHHIDSPLPLD